MKLNEEQALHRAAAYCSKAERSEYDVSRKLQQWEIDDEAASRIIKRLRDEKFVDNIRFCRFFINDKAKFNKWGRKKICFELKKKQIREQDFSHLLDEIDSELFDAQLNTILKQKLKTTKAKDNYDLRYKLIRFALGRGFSMDQIVCQLNKLLRDCDEPMD